MSFILNIDTSLETASVSISSDGEIVDVITNAVQKEHATFVHIAINVLLAKTNLKIGNLAAIATTVGPGSYTGLRVGLSAAKGLSYALNKPLITVGTLEIMTKDILLQYGEKQEFLYCPMIDARRMEVFTAIYDSKLNEILAPQAMVLNHDSFLAYYGDKNLVFFGSGMNKWREFPNINNSLFYSNTQLANALSKLVHNKYIISDFANLTTSVPQYSKGFYTQ